MLLLSKLSTNYSDISRLSECTWLRSWKLSNKEVCWREACWTDYLCNFSYLICRPISRNWYLIQVTRCMLYQFQLLFLKYFLPEMIYQILNHSVGEEDRKKLLNQVSMLSKSLPDSKTANSDLKRLSNTLVHDRSLLKVWNQVEMIHYCPIFRQMLFTLLFAITFHLNKLFPLSSSFCKFLIYSKQRSFLIPRHSKQ